jgi:pyoverdine/dityrosine biosynthesis protein Dit1
MEIEEMENLTVCHVDIEALNTGDSTVNAEILADQVLNIIFDKRRLLPNEATAEINEHEEQKAHFDRIFAYVEAGEKIQMILPAFPVKSPNRNKTLTHLPDYAERHAFQQLSILCDDIKSIYSPGVEFTICSDGRVFSDLLRISDEHVTEYGETLRSMVEESHPGVFTFFNLDKVYNSISCFDTMREDLMVNYGEALSDLVYRTKTEPHAKSMYLGITRFIFEDFSGIDPFKKLARNAIQKAAKSVSYRVIQRSNAWSKLLKEQYPKAVRLSIHPQFRVSEKIGIYLGDVENSWVTPWHSVAVIDEDRVLFMKRSDAESQPDVLLAYHDGQPSHFVRRAQLERAS